MNHLRIDQLANHLDVVVTDAQFTMTDFVCRPGTDDLLHIEDLADCGTAGCIAGWTVFLFGDEDQKAMWAALGNARKLLDLTERESSELFLHDYHHTRTQAVQKLRIWASNARRMEKVK